MISEQDTVCIIDTITLSDNWYILKKYVVDYLRRDGAPAAIKSGELIGGKTIMLLQHPALSGIMEK